MRWKKCLLSKKDAQIESQTNRMNMAGCISSVVQWVTLQVMSEKLQQSKRNHPKRIFLQETI